MSFTSTSFFIFLLGALFLYGILPQQFRWGLLLTASYLFFYTWNPQYLWVLPVITLVTYFAARKIHETETQKAKAAWLALGLLTLIGFLFAFKYYDYVLRLAAGLLLPGQELNLPVLDVVAPIGIAFFSLQIISYLIDVYRGQQTPEKHLGYYALFVSFFPQLLAGPITRAKKLLPQIHALPSLLPDELQIGFQRILWGGLQKFVIADRLSIVTDPVFAAPQTYGSQTLLIVLYLYAIQIYCDFAGYSNLAFGLAKLFGVDLAENFNHPYLALDIADFWNRWHISLSNWLRDYIFYPVMRFLRKHWRKAPGIILIGVPPLITMLVSGVWHGVGPNYVLWGLMHGVMLALSAATARRRKNFAARLGKWGWAFNALQIAVTFHFLVFSWVFFRMPGIGPAAAYLQRILAWVSAKVLFTRAEIAVVVTVLALYFLFESIRLLGWTLERWKQLPLPVRWATYYLVIFILLFMGNFTSSQPFIYEQF